MRKNITKLIKNGLLIASAALLIQGNIMAAPYGSGGYGDCQYGEGCTTTTPTNTDTKPDPTPPMDKPIVLNDYEEYFTNAGKSFLLKAEKTIYYDVTINGSTQRYSITITTIGSDTITITLSPDGRKQLLNINDPFIYDANNDGQNDIQIRLDGIDDETANINFKNLAVGTDISPPAPIQPKTSKQAGWLTGLYIFLILLGLFIFIIILLKRRRDKDKDKNQSGTPGQFIQPGPRI